MGHRGGGHGTHQRWGRIRGGRRDAVSSGGPRPRRRARRLHPRSAGSSARSDTARETGRSRRRSPRATGVPSLDAPRRANHPGGWLRRPMPVGKRLGLAVEHEGLAEREGVAERLAPAGRRLRRHHHPRSARRLTHAVSPLPATPRNGAPTTRAVAVTLQSSWPKSANQAGAPRKRPRDARKAPPRAGVVRVGRPSPLCLLSRRFRPGRPQSSDEETRAWRPRVCSDPRRPGQRSTHLITRERGNKTHDGSKYHTSIIIDSHTSTGAV